MALDPSAAYPGQVDTTDPTGYPWGKAKNVGSIGDGTGTPLERLWVSDVFGFQQALLKASGLTPSGTPDKVGASQYLDAVRSASRRELQKSQAQNWPERTNFPSGVSNNLIGLGYGPDLGVGGGGLWVLQTSGTDVWSSEDGLFWTMRAASLGSASFTNPWIAYGKINSVSGFLLSQNANPGVYYTSTDGINWTLVSTAAVPANPVSAYSQSLGLWVMAGNAGAVSTSPTGLANTWTARTTPAGWQSSSGGAKRIVWNGSLFVILPLASPGGYSKCLTSPDGVTWTERNLGSNQLWVGLAHSATEGRWMAVSDGGYVATSADGLTWSTPITLPYGAKDLAALGAVWAAPTRNAAAGGITFSVDNGVTWTPVNVGSHRDSVAVWSRIIAGDGRFAVAHQLTSTGALEVQLSQRSL
jgi:hypothetical protein